MGLFKKDKKDSQMQIDNSQLNIPSEQQPLDHVKRKKKIGFGQKKKNKNIMNKPIPQQIQQLEPEKNASSASINNIPEDVRIPELYSSISDSDLFLENTLSQDGKKQMENKQEPEKDWTQVQKRNALLQKDLKGKPVFLEDTGEQLGVVFDTIRDNENKVIGYKIKDSKSDAILSFPLDQFDEDKSGLIFVPSWYTKGLKTVEKLEFKDRISPELPWLLKDQTISDEELYKIFVKHDDIIANYMEESITLRELLASRLKVLEKERLGLKEDLMDLTEKRLIKDIDRRKFSEIVMEHRRKVNVIDVNIKKCKELLNRLEQTSFGMLGKTISSRIEKKEWNEQKNQIQTEHYMNSFQNNGNDVYKEKYEKIKTSFDELEEEYKNLRDAVETKLDDSFENKYYELKDNYDELLSEYDELKIAVEKILQKNNP